MVEGSGIRLGREAAARLAELGCCEIRPGLTDSEFGRIEMRYGFEFADEHRAFLAAGLPVRDSDEDDAEWETWKKPWPDWRDGAPEDLQRHLDWPVDAAIWQVEQERYWPRGWSERPADPVEAVARARQRLQGVPPLVPVYAHRFLPAGRGSWGHPVLSVWQLGDIICYGGDLNVWVRLEFTDVGDDWRSEQWKSRVTVPFWRDYLL
ncbi:hypothetical protein [Nocardia jinanensis]|uniref:SMI1/KNR4 family protein n=1 Tax=Nocardia jinanensis TaxID=382504 RepID=A0A917RZZ1_9NOCA|nr:hypothetical protein [Nocardia jinanensis]GGL45799.1 hypothetical protein GCM10011588_70690 [Nocardia jinanensis]